MLKDIFEGTPQHQYYIELVRDQVEPQVRKEVREQALEEGREEERQVRLQEEDKLLLMIVKARFPTLTRLAKTQAKQIKDVAVMKEVFGKVGAAQSAEEAVGALLIWLPDDDSEK